MRARAGTVGGVVLVGAFAATALWATLTASRADPDERDSAPEAAAEALVQAWERSRLGTFVVTGTWQRRSDSTGSALRSAHYVAQRPPDRLHRQLGGVSGRHDDRLVVCPAMPGGEGDASPCSLGEPGGPTYDESVAAEVEGLRSLVTGDQPVYSVTADGSCFDLAQRIVEPRAPFGVSAHLCFDPESGAPSGHEVRFEGGIREVVVVDDIRTEVTDADLEP